MIKLKIIISGPEEILYVLSMHDRTTNHSFKFSSHCYHEIIATLTNINPALTTHLPIPDENTALSLYRQRLDLIHTMNQQYLLTSFKGYYEETLHIQYFEEIPYLSTKATSLLTIDHNNYTYYFYSVDTGDLQGIFSSIKDLDVLKKTYESLPRSFARETLLTEKAAAAIVHEALGHLLEEDEYSADLYNYLKENRLRDITVIDNPSLDHLAGSYVYDDEASMAQKQVLIHKGDLLRFMGTKNHHTYSQRGNARCVDYSEEPIARMSNLYLDKGYSTNTELENHIIKNDGIIIYDFGYGACHGFEIELKINHAAYFHNGKKQYFDNALVKTDLYQFITNIHKLGDTVVMQNMECSKYNQWYYEVSTGSPQILLKELQLCVL